MVILFEFIQFVCLHSLCLYWGDILILVLYVYCLYHFFIETKVLYDISYSKFKHKGAVNHYKCDTDFSKYFDTKIAYV